MNVLTFQATISKTSQWLASAILGVALFSKPSSVGNFDIRTVPPEEEMTISISKSAPPLAAIQDEFLPELNVEPAIPMKAKPGQELLVAGKTVSWSKLQKYAVAFQRYSKIWYRQNQELGPKANAILAQASGKPINPEDVRLVVATPLTEMKYGVKSALDHEQIKEDLAQQTSPSVAPPKVAVSDVLTTEIQDLAGQVKKSKAGSLGYLVASADDGHEAINQIEPENSDAGAPRMVSSRSAAGTIGPDSQSKGGASKLASSSMASEAFKLTGSVELSGGLAVAGELTKLIIQWRNENQTRRGMIDLTSGHFAIGVPALGKGKLVATLTNARGKILGLGEADLEVEGLSQAAYLSDIQITVEPVRSQLVGMVYNALASNEDLTPVRNAEVFGPAAGRELTDKNGIYRLGTINSESTFVLETFAQEMWATRQIGSGHLKIRTPLYSENMMESFIAALGRPSGIYENGVILGQVSQGGKPISGVRVGLSSAGAVGPIYFNSARLPDTRLKSTSSNGLYAFVKVPQGLHVVFASQGSAELPSSIVSAAPHTVSPANIRVQTLEARGRIYDPVERKTVSGLINAIGYSGSAVSTEEKGFQLKLPSSDPVVFFETRSKDSNYVVTRSGISRAEASSGADILTVKKAWLNKNLKLAGVNMKNQKSMVVGYAKGPSFHVHVEGMPTGEYVDENVFYLNENGDIDPNLTEGISGGGGFVITNLKPGPHVVVISTLSGDMSTSRIVVAEPAVLSSVIVDLDN